MFTGSLLVPIGGFYIDPLTGLPVIDWGLAFSAVIFWIIGSLFILLGVYASFFKVNTELLIEELKKEITFWELKNIEGYIQSNYPKTWKKEVESLLDGEESGDGLQY